MKVYNQQKYKNLRKALRKQEISSEKLLWSKLRNRQQGFKFRRQYGVGKFIIDFYCPEVRLAIEIDGATHSTPEEIEKDLFKESFLNKLKIKVKRYSNNDIYKNLESVLEDIHHTCLELNDGG